MHAGRLLPAHVDGTPGSRLRAVDTPDQRIAQARTIEAQIGRLCPTGRGEDPVLASFA